MNLIYLHGFASGPQSNKAQFFRRRFEVPQEARHSCGQLTEIEARPLADQVALHRRSTGPIAGSLERVVNGREEVAMPNGPLMSCIVNVLRRG